jgi:hypothetical protein
MHIDKGAFDFYADDIEAFVGNDYTPLAVSGMTEPDETEEPLDQTFPLLDGSTVERLGPTIRIPKVDFGVLQTKADRIFIRTWMKQTDKVLYYDNEECQVVLYDPTGYSQPWAENLEIGRSAALKLREKTAWTTAPPSWSRT